MLAAAWISAVSATGAERLCWRHDSRAVRVRPYNAAMNTNEPAQKSAFPSMLIPVLPPVRKPWLRIAMTLVATALLGALAAAASADVPADPYDAKAREIFE